MKWLMAKKFEMLELWLEQETSTVVPLHHLHLHRKNSVEINKWQIAIPTREELKIVQ